MNTSEDSIRFSDSPFCRNSTIGENELQDTSICQNATENFTVLTTQKVNKLYGSGVVTYFTPSFIHKKKYYDTSFYIIDF